MLVLFNKPFGVLCQFTDLRKGDEPGRPTLAQYLDIPGVYPAGRLDLDSEGLVLLTDDGKLQAQIANPAHGSSKEYLVQVEGAPKTAQLKRLTQGVKLSDGPARAIDVSLMPGKPGWVWTRNPPIRQRKSIPVSWLQVTLNEGRNRQLRRMTAAVGLPTLRLIRKSVGAWSLQGLAPGEFRIVQPENH